MRPWPLLLLHLPSRNLRVLSHSFVPCVLRDAAPSSELLEEGESVNQITMIGHSTVLIGSTGECILTDPYFSLHGNPAYARPFRLLAREKK